MNGLKEAIIAHPFFGDMKPEHLETISVGADVAEFGSDEVLFREGEPANRFHLIQSGRIALEAHDPADGTALVEYLGAGDVLGWSWLFPPFVYHFRARAVEPSRVIAINGGHLLVAAEKNHELGYELMKRLAQVVIQRLQATRRQLLNQQIETVLET